MERRCIQQQKTIRDRSVPGSSLTAMCETELSRNPTESTCNSVARNHILDRKKAKLEQPSNPNPADFPYISLTFPTARPRRVGASQGLSGLVVQGELGQDACHVGKELHLPLGDNVTLWGRKKVCEVKNHHVKKR